MKDTAAGLQSSNPRSTARVAPSMGEMRLGDDSRRAGTTEQVG